MTEEEAIVHYLRTFAGQKVAYCKMLNTLASAMTGYVRNRFPVPRNVRRATWLRLQAATSRLVKRGVVVRNRTRQVDKRGRHPTVRLNESFVKNPVL